jgi:hypothetical protein
MKPVILFFFLLAPLPAAEKIRIFHPDGGWCWFEDERAVVIGDHLVFGVVATGGRIQAVSYDLRNGTSQVTNLHLPDSPQEQRRWFDDHNSPAFLLLPDGRLLAMYSLHGGDARIYYRISEPRDYSKWGEEQIYVPSPSSRVTYSNLHYLSEEKRIYDFFRGLDNTFKPSYASSDDFGKTWKTGNVFIDVPLKFRHRPYVKYASNGRDTVHIAYTEGHPRDFDNSIYHVFYRAGVLHRSDGTAIRGLRDGLRAPEEGTRVFTGDAQNVAWISDLHLDRAGRPVLVFSVQKDSAGLPSKQGGEDHRYHYARWTGPAWETREIAFAGTKLYPGEDDYTGNIAIDPADTSTVYLSTNADPKSGKALISASDGRRHWEIFRGRIRGDNREWTAVTRDSTEDQIRPIVPTGGKLVLWLRGAMKAYTDYRFEVAGLLLR